MGEAEGGGDDLGAGVVVVVVVQVRPDGFEGGRGQRRSADPSDTDKLASLNRSWQSKEGTYRALGMAGIEPTPSKSECDWTPLSPLTTWPRGRLFQMKNII